MEIWKDIKDFEGFYQVSNYGNVKSLERIVECSNGRQRLCKEKVLKLRKNNNGYLDVHLYKEGKGKTMKVHRLVAQAFIDNPSNHPIISHKDENPLNNCVSNLEWCTQEYNINYGTRNERMAATKKENGQYERIAATNKVNGHYEHLAELSKLRCSKPVFQYSISGDFIAKYESTIEAARQLHYSQGNISSCCRGERKTHKDYLWSYEPLQQPLQLGLNFSD